MPRTKLKSSSILKIMRLKKLGLPIIFIIITLLVFFVLKEQASTPAPSSGNTSQYGEFDKKQLSLTDPSSVWVIANKQSPLSPIDYAPTDLVVPDVNIRANSSAEEKELRKVASQALEKMFEAAKKDGLPLIMASGYRSYSLQTSVYNRYVKTEGQASADSQSARPGYSEHQTGLAVDVGGANRVCEIQDCFANTKESKWIADNAHKFGYIIRYQKDTRAIVGYIYEPWHLRYVGEALAGELHDQNNPPLETFFDLPAAPDY